MRKGYVGSEKAKESFLNNFLKTRYAEHFGELKKISFFLSSHFLHAEQQLKLGACSA